MRRKDRTRRYDGGRAHDFVGGRRTFGDPTRSPMFIVWTPVGFQTCKLFTVSLYTTPNLAHFKSFSLQHFQTGRSFTCPILPLHTLSNFTRSLGPIHTSNFQTSHCTFDTFKLPNFQMIQASKLTLYPLLWKVPSKLAGQCQRREVQSEWYEVYVVLGAHCRCHTECGRRKMSAQPSAVQAATAPRC